MTRSGLRLLCLPALLLWVLAVQAHVEVREFASEVERQRFRELAAELRCPKCQNQNILDSDAPIAVDLREALHERLRAGDSDAEIFRYMTDRYGEFIRYRPDWRGPTAWLWLLPALLLSLGVLGLWRLLRRHANAPAAPLEEIPND